MASHEERNGIPCSLSSVRLSHARHSHIHVLVFKPRRHDEISAHLHNAYVDFRRCSVFNISHKAIQRLWWSNG